MDNLHLRIRIDRAIAEKAMKMAQERGMELPDVIRMMVTKAVRIGDFSIDDERPQEHRVAEATRPYFAYDDRQWDSSKTVLDAELALALINQFVASHTILIQSLLDADHPQDSEIARLQQEREIAREDLATLDPADAEAIRALLTRYGPAADPENQEESG
ncbi:hypothetical protein QTH97_23925 [Variovorax sp. J22R24]|uniref:hypothetical protein n=1 Tax=Variovorax gracilis TaxID=3053502 RepID=UPI0025762B46|nr:hypothetical protein [Variovorax sp. J22R24]MDM0108018.1 hypothetical protein [Variovorax sp. J22R24]